MKRVALTLAFGIPAFILLYLGAYRSGEKVQLTELSSGYPSKAARFEFMRRMNPYTGTVPPGAAWKALKQLIAEGRIAPEEDEPGRSSGGWRRSHGFFNSLSITKLTYDPRRTTDFYFCTGEGWFNWDAVRGAGVWKSYDAGLTWFQIETTDTSIFDYCQDMLVHPANSHIYVATRTGGLQRSVDGGATWQMVLGAGAGALKNSVCDLELTRNGGMFAGIGIFETDGLYYSATGDSGTWVRQTNGFPAGGIWRVEVAAALSNDSVAYATAVATDDSIIGIYRTADRGNTWVQVSNPGGNRKLAAIQGWYDLILAVDPNDENVVVAGGLHLWKTTDGGSNWTRISHGKQDSAGYQYVHVDQHEVVFRGSDTVYFGNDGGIWKSDRFTDSLPVIYNKNMTYNVTQFYACAIHPDPGSHVVIGGTQDNGSGMAETPGLSTFGKLSGADGGFCAINFLDGNIMFTTTQERRMYRFRNGGPVPKDTVTNPYVTDNEVLFINPFEMDPADPEKLFMASSRGVWRLKNASTADTTQWEKASRSIGSISAIGIAKSPPNILYIGRYSTNGRIYRIDASDISDANYMPNDADPMGTLPSSLSFTIYASCVYVDPSDAAHVIVTYSNYGIPSVFESFNASDPSPSWRSVEGNLPDIPVFWALLHPQDPDVCYLATEIGVFYTGNLDGDSTQWVISNQGMGNVRTDMLRLRASDNTVAAATHGKGIYTGILPSAPPYAISWFERGPTNVGGRTRTIMVDPNDPTGKKVWAGSVSGGLWWTDDIEEVESAVPDITPAGTVLFRCYPNPAGEGPVMGFFRLLTASNVAMRIYDVSGRMVFTRSYGHMPAGMQAVSFQLPAWVGRGVYNVALHAGDVTYAARLVYLP